MVASVAVAATLTVPVNDPMQIQDALNRNHPTTMTVLTGLGVLARVLAIAGKALCLSVPAAVGASAFIVMALAFVVTSLAMDVAARAAQAGEAQADLALVGVLAWLLGYFAFVRFLRRLAEYLRLPGLSERGRRLLIGSMTLVLAVMLAAFARALGEG